jgi:hypothetical protein
MSDPEPGPAEKHPPTSQNTDEPRHGTSTYPDIEVDLEYNVRTSFLEVKILTTAQAQNDSDIDSAVGSMP